MQGFLLDLVNKRDQTGLNMYSHDVNGFTWGFHKLMLVGEGNEKSYMNWSYRNKRFDPLSERTRESMHLDKIMKCNPVPHFALNLQ